MATVKLTREQVHVMGAVTFGTILEWFEVYSYIYFVPIMARAFFPRQSVGHPWIAAFLVFGIGFIARPLGGLLFGRLGDHRGRKKAFIRSIILMTIPTVAMGCLPTYAHIGIYAPILLVVLRLAQAIPESGEVPGATCYLYESAPATSACFFTSWVGVGNQIGAILAVVEIQLMDRFMSGHFLETWGWRISFWSGGLIGLCGLYLRHTLHETPKFADLKRHHKIDTESVWEVIVNFRKKIALGVALGVINAATFYLIAAYIPTYLLHHLDVGPGTITVASLTMLILSTIALPIFGALGDRYSNRKMLVASALLIIGLLIPTAFAISSKSLFWLIVIGLLYVPPTSCISALILYRLAKLFPTSVRFTGVGLCFNLADGIVGGFTPVIAIVLVMYTGDQAAFCGYIALCAVISLVAYFKIRDQ